MVAIIDGNLLGQPVLLLARRLKRLRLVYLARMKGSMIAVGTGIGVAIGVAMDNIAAGLAMGIAMSYATRP